MKTEDLIKRLAAQGPARGWLTIGRAALLWWGSLLLWTFFILFYPPMHSLLLSEDIGRDPLVPFGSLALSATLALLFAGTVGHAALWLATPIPGRHAKRYLAAATAFLALFVVTIWVGYPEASPVGEARHFLAHLECPEHLLLISVLPGVGLFLATRSLGQFSPWLSGAAGLAAAGGSGLLGVQLLCPNYSFVHVMTSHLLPLMPLALLGALFFQAFGGITRQVEALRRKL